MSLTYFTLLQRSPSRKTMPKVKLHFRIPEYHTKTTNYGYTAYKFRAKHPSPLQGMLQQGTKLPLLTLVVGFFNHTVQ